MNLHTRKCIIILIVFQFFIVSGLVPAARAAIVPTQTLIEAEQGDTTRARIQSMLAQEDVRAELMRLGVEPVMAEERIAALTPAELQLLQRHIDEMPAGAGGGALAVIGIVFLVLLILELVGVTNVFSKI
ncbi:MAG: PA2779 family protein [Desulforhopalus sp.]